MMFKNYFKIGIRNYLKYNIHPIISTLGLSIAFCSIIIIAFWVKDEIGFDRFYSNTHRIYRVFIEEQRNSGESKYPWTSFPLAEELVSTIPDIQTATTVGDGNMTIRYESNLFNEDRVCFTDNSFFKIFDFHFLTGNKDKALGSIESMVITEKAAKKYFGDKNPIGEKLLVNGMYNFIVEGVIENIPDNSEFQFDYFIRAQDYSPKLAGCGINWEALNFETYIEVHKNVNINDTRAKMRDVMVKNLAGSKQLLNIQPLKDKHLFWVDGNPTNKKNVNTMSVIVILILLIAFINFINLALSAYHKRVPELLVKNIFGAKPFHLFFQIFTDTLIIVLISGGLAMVLSELFLPFVNRIIGKSLLIDYNNLKSMIALFTFFILAILILSVVIFFIISSKHFRSVLASKNSIHPIGQYRNILVLLQFVIAIILIISSNFVSRQMDFINKRNIGFNPDNIIFVRLNGNTRKTYPILKYELLKFPEIENITACYNLPTNINNSCNIENWAGRQNQERLPVAYTVGDFDYIKTLEMKLVAGRDFSEESVLDTMNYIVNETTIKKLGINNPIGTKIDFGCWYEGEIIGVVKDFNFHSLRSIIRPLVIASPSWGYHYLLIKFDVKKNTELLENIGMVWAGINAEYPFEYNYLTDTFDKTYHKDKVFRIMLLFFTYLSILISVMGLFGLVSLTAHRRTKEIGIRKTNGAGTPEIMIMLSKDFTKWVVIAFLIASPIAYFVINKWIQGFAYRTNLSWWVFAAAGVLALAVALLTVSWQSWRAASKNPVEALRYE